MQKLKVLAIGNDRVTRRVINSLEGTGIDIVSRSEFAEAVSLLKKEKFDLALLDGYSENLESNCYRLTWQCHTPVALIIKGTDADWNILRNLDVDGYIPEEARNIELIAHFTAIARRGNRQPGKVKILIIEDDEPTQEALRLSFQIYWPEAIVCFAAEGEEGVFLARSEQRDAILLDLKLPDIPGLEVLKTIRTFSLTPVLIVTANKNQDDIIRTIGAGANDYILKPFKQLELMSRVRQQINLGVAALRYNYN
jgi:DNA-binding response OmpR family regulator